ncbi:MAG: GTP 3',8-cyclase MoaA [Aquificaceae bacterium]|nr:MAG: GTP 3',8-cyclase MoaA [Aquificaceae bacterium]
MTAKESKNKTQLIDRFGRKVSYLRMSATDRCDLRCVYCMSEDMTFVPREQLLTLEEMIRIGTTAVDLGVNKIRITGGEPLTRTGIISVFQALGKLEGLDDLTITTNGTQLERFAQPLKDAGVTRINISLDTLQKDRFKELTRNGKIEKTLSGIDAAIKANFKAIKLNTVILKNRNDDEILDLIQYVEERGIDISFIEEMPLGVITEHDRAESYYSSEQIKADIRQQHSLIRSSDKTGGPSRYYQLNQGSSRVGFISPHSHNFCDSCNRVRLTAEGRLLLCLGQEHSVDLRRVVRANPLDDTPLRHALIQSMDIKPKGHEFILDEQPLIFRHMSSTGG